MSAGEIDEVDRSSSGVGGELSVAAAGGHSTVAGLLLRPGVDGAAAPL